MVFTVLRYDPDNEGKLGFSRYVLLQRQLNQSQAHLDPVT